MQHAGVTLRGPATRLEMPTVPLGFSPQCAGACSRTKVSTSGPKQAAACSLHGGLVSFCCPLLVHNIRKECVPVTNDQLYPCPPELSPLELEQLTLVTRIARASPWWHRMCGSLADAEQEAALAVCRALPQCPPGITADHIPRFKKYNPAKLQASAIAKSGCSTCRSGANSFMAKA